MAEMHRTPPEGRMPVPGRVDAGARPADEPSLGELFKELGSDLQTLFRQEVQLARTEATEKARRAGRHAAFVAAGGFVAYAGFVAVVAAIGFLLATVMPTWLAFLIAGALVIAGGYALIQKGIDGLKSTDFSLSITADTLREDKQWIEQEVREVKRDPSHLGARG
jgi:hypothetical protein